MAWFLHQWRSVKNYYVSTGVSKDYRINVFTFFESEMKVSRWVLNIIQGECYS